VCIGTKVQSALVLPFTHAPMCFHRSEARPLACATCQALGPRLSTMNACTCGSGSANTPTCSRACVGVSCTYSLQLIADCTAAARQPTRASRRSTVCGSHPCTGGPEHGPGAHCEHTYAMHIIAYYTPKPRVLGLRCEVELGVA
jgi:hypothetical protein